MSPMALHPKSVSISVRPNSMIPPSNIVSVATVSKPLPIRSPKSNPKIEAAK